MTRGQRPGQGGPEGERGPMSEPGPSASTVTPGLTDPRHEAGPLGNELLDDKYAGAKAPHEERRPPVHSRQADEASAALSPAPRRLEGGADES